MSWVLKYNIYIFSLCRQFKWRIIWYGMKNNNYVCGFTINDNVFAELLFYKIQSIDNIKFVPDCRILRKLLRIKNDINFFPQLQQLLNNKIPIVTAINMCAKSNNNPHTRYMLLRLANQVTAGINLYTALEEFNYCFDSIIIGLIMVGELSGTLNTTLGVIDKKLNHHQEYRKKIKTALRYPLTILITAIMIIMFFLFEIIPSFSGIFNDIGAETPPITQYLLEISILIKKNNSNISIFITTFVIYIFFFPFPQIKKKSSLKIPFLNKLYFQKNFSLSLSIMLNQNITIKQSLIYICANEKDIEIKELINIVIKSITNGNSFASACKSVKIYDETQIMQIELAENSGNLVKTLNSIAIVSEKKLLEKIDYCCELLQPIIITLVGIIIGFMLFTLYSPILNAPLTL